jgi:hypothetical protein
VVYQFHCGIYVGFIPRYIALHAAHVAVHAATGTGIAHLRATLARWAHRRPAGLLPLMRSLSRGSEHRAAAL